MLRKLNTYKGWTLDVPHYNAPDVDAIFTQIVEILDENNCGYAQDLKEQIQQVLADSIAKE